MQNGNHETSKDENSGTVRAVRLHFPDLGAKLVQSTGKVEVRGSGGERQDRSWMRRALKIPKIMKESEASVAFGFELSYMQSFALDEL